MIKTSRFGAALLTLAVVVIGWGTSGGQFAHADATSPPAPSYSPRGSAATLTATGSPALRDPNIPSKTQSGGLSTAAIASVTTSNAPPTSYSWYPTSTDLAHATTTIKNWGINAPFNKVQMVFLETGAWCSGQAFTSGQYGSSSCIDNYTLAFDLEYFMYGYEGNHSNMSSMDVVATSNNSGSAGRNTTNAGANGSDWAGAVYNNLQQYANSLNNYNAGKGLPLRFYTNAGSDVETNFNLPPAITDWVSGFNSGDTNGGYGLMMLDNGAYYSTCASSSCWNTVLDHGWKPSQKYYTTYGGANDFGFPEVYNSSWATYYKDLDTASVSARAPFAPPSWTGAFWGCGTGGSEPSAKQAWTDFANRVGQSPTYSTTIHSLGKTC